MMLGSGKCMNFNMSWYVPGEPALLSVSSEAWLSHCCSRAQKGAECCPPAHSVYFYSL